MVRTLTKGVWVDAHDFMDVVSVSLYQAGMPADFVVENMEIILKEMKSLEFIEIDSAEEKVRIREKWYESI